MKTLRIAVLFAGVVSMLSFTARAHHATSAYYLVNQTAEITGIVKDYRLVNPHLRMEVDVTDETGETATWLFEGPVAGDLRRAGWTQDSLEMGETITVTFNPARNLQFKGGHVLSILKQNGTNMTHDEVVETD
jgi:hypothetical protein